MNKNHCKQENIRLGTHGEDYGSWMSNPVFYIIGGIGVLAAVHANSIYCRDCVGLISVAHQAILRSNSRTSREFGVGYSHSCRKR